MLFMASDDNRRPGWFKHREKVWGAGRICAWWSKNHGRCQQPAVWKFRLNDGLCDHHDLLLYERLKKDLPCADEKPRIWSPADERFESEHD